MAEDNKQPSVELDTDGVNEEIVNVAAPEEDKDTSFSKKEEVDLGYTDVSNNSSKEEVKVEQVKDEPKEEVRESKNQEDDSNLKDYSDNVQRRIKKLTFQAKESERRERAALDYAKGLKDKYESIQTKFDETDTNYLKEYNARVDAEREKVKAALKVALEAQDADQIMEANDKLTKLAVEKEKISMTLGEKEYRKKQQETQSAERPAGEPVELQQPKISQKAQRWAEDNDWFGSDRVLTSAAMGIHEDLV